MRESRWKGTRRFLLLGIAGGIPLVWAVRPAVPQLLPAMITIAVDGRTVAEAADPRAALSIVVAERRGHPNAAIVVRFPSATYQINTPLLVGPAETGSGTGSLILRGAPDGTTVIKGSIEPALPTTPVRTIDPITVPGLIPPTLAYRSYLQQDGDSLPLLFDRDRPVELSRWPARSYLDGWRVTSAAEGGTLLTRPGFAPPPGVPVLVSGYITADWAYEVIPGRTVPNGIFLSGYHPAAPPQARIRLAVLNLDRDDGRAHYRLDGSRIILSGLSADARIAVAVTPELMVVERAHNLTVDKIAFEHSAGNGIRIYVSSQITFRDCYVGAVKRHGISIEGGDHIAIDGCVVAGAGLGGITMFGGDRATLTPSGHVVTDTIVTDTGRRVRSYAPGVALLGTGNQLLRSRITGMPHAGVGVSGNDNRVESNDIHAVACETGDVGAVYMGRDWTQRGNRITGNFIHDIGTGNAALGNSAIYLDDQFSGAEISGNVILRARQGVVIGGGRDNIVTGNVFAGLALSAIWFDQRGLEAQKADTVPGGFLYRTLTNSPFRTPLWQARYPRLAALPDQNPGTPVGNHADDNIVLGAPFLQSQPAGLTLAGKGNRTGPLPSFADRTPTGQFAILSRLSTAVHSAPMPGPSRALLYATRIRDVADCDEFMPD